MQRAEETEPWWVDCFNPHRSRGTGATVFLLISHRPAIGFNPHRSRGTGATWTGLRPFAAIEFQSSPVPRDRCNTRDYQVCYGTRVSILTGPEGPVQPLALSYPLGDTRFNPHRSRGTGATRCSLMTSCTIWVSILTGPEGPVQPVSLGSMESEMIVSILTGPEGPVQPKPTFICAVTSTSFNPHRSRGTGATPRPVRSPQSRKFQSSPVPRDRCNSVRRLLPPRHDCFNPHRSRGTGATNTSTLTPAGCARFQSSPVPRDRCNLRKPSPSSEICGFNPHRSRGTGATLAERTTRGC